MNILVNSFGTQSKRLALIQLSEKLEIDYLYISSETNTEGIKAKKIETFNEGEIPWAWEDLNYKEISIDLDILKEFKETEAGFFYLLERYQTFYHQKGFPKEIGGTELNKALFNKYYNPYYSPSDGKRLYHLLLNKWVSYIKKKQIDLYITSHTPHEPERYLMYQIVRFFKIPTIALGFTSIPGRILIYDHFENNLPQIKTKYESILRQEEIILSEDMNEIYKEKTQPIEKQEELFYMNENFFETSKPIKKSRILSVINTIFKKGGDLDYLYFWFKGAGINRFKSNINRYFEKHSVSEGSLPSKFFYFPLHVQPELTTFPKGKDFTDQLLVIDYLSNFLPEEVKIVVKEHPNQKIRGPRSPLFYNELIFNPKIVIANTKLNSKRLIEKSLAVVSLTGTVLWEAMFLNKPGLMFGYHSNMFLPNTQTVRNLDECKTAISNILNNNIVVSEKKIKAILYALDAITTRGFIDDVSKRGLKISDFECAKNISKAIYLKILSYKNLQMQQERIK